MAFTESFLAANLDKFPSNQVPLLKQRLNELDDDQTDFIYSTDLKNPQTALILSIFLGVFGVDRFYIGDTMLGILKFLFSWATFGIWVIIDWFLIQKACKRNNLKKVQSAIGATTRRTAKKDKDLTFEKQTEETPVLDFTEVDEIEKETLQDGEFDPADPLGPNPLGDEEVPERKL